ncbi:MAG: class I SAM-dependent methyltransferase [Bacilli bacterium]|nr:class I SAM-dependent methyltransferase [Bacilli bacterium]
MAQYFENANLPSNIVEFETYFLNTKFTFKSDNGVFSKEKLDFGTRLLLENLPFKDMNGDILDLGCGYGVVSIILSKFIDAKFDAVDVNKRALHLAEMNMKLNKVTDINYFESNCYDAIDENKKYSYIITNPPIRAGKEVVYKMLRGAKDHLKDDGFLYFVMRKDHGAKTAIRDISDIYNAEVICKEKGFFVIKCFLR